uniref:Unspecific monooxygenase n=1 Tax=Pseudonaja textilis TaxID=8673 RepID=A0A670Y576_PSETE
MAYSVLGIFICRSFLKMSFAMDEVSFSGVIIALCIVVSLFIYVRMLTKNKQPYPPGPWSLPILGNLLQLGDHPYVFFDQMRKKYGDVFQIQLGMVPVVVVNGLHAARHVLLKDGESFAGRPDILSFSVKFGESWNLQKKVAAKALKSLAKSEARSSTCSCLLEEHVCAEASERMKTFLELSKKGSFDPVAATTCTVANVVSALCFGKRYSQCDEEFLSIIQMSHGLIKASSIFNPADFIPCLRYLPLPAAKVARAFYGKFNNFLAQHVKDHYVTYGKASTYDKIRLTVGIEKCFSIAYCFGTLSSCLQWIFLYLTNNPEIQMKIQEEIGNAFVAPKFEDRKDLHYTEAFINEVFRHSSFIPFTKPHCTTKDTVLNGYYIPQNTCIFINMYQVNHDENLWIDPDIFKPQRFLNENGEFNKSLIEKILIFGIGLRKCLGEEIFLILTTILQQLRLEKLFEDQLEITPVYGLSMTPKKPQRMQIYQFYSA